MEEDSDTSGDDSFVEEPEAEEAYDDEPLTDDLPCIRCTYNLRGLKPSGNCPECGAAILKSLDFATERILCLACMKPNHPSAAVCDECGSPLHTAGGTADYFRLHARGVRRRPDVDEDVEAHLADMQAQQKPKHVARPNPAGVIVVGIFMLSIAIVLLSLGADAWENHDTDVCAVLVVFAVIVGAVPILPVRKYARQRDDYLTYRNRRLKELQETPAAAIPSSALDESKPREQDQCPPDSSDLT